VKYSIPINEIAVLFEFLGESAEHLEGIEDKILKLEVSEDADLVNSIFRPIHTIKGSSSFLGLDNIGQLSHQLETLLDDIRKSRIKTIDSEIIDLLLESIDTISKMLTNTQTATETVDQSRDPLETEIEDVPYEKLIERIIEIRKIKSEKPSETFDNKNSSVPVTAEPVPPGVDYAGIMFPGDMKEQFLMECVEHVGVIEKNLLALEKSPGEFTLYNDLLRALHSLKGNTGVILSVIDDEELRKKHYLNDFKRMAHLTESIVQRKRDKKQALKEPEVELLLSMADFQKCMLHTFKTNRPLDKKADNLLNQLKFLSESVEESPPPTPGNLKEIGGDSLAEAVSNSMTQAMQAISAGLEELGAPKTRSTALKKLKRAYKNLYKIGSKINHNFLVNKSTNGMNLIDFMTTTKDENESLFIENLKQELEELIRQGDRRKSKDMQDRRKATIPPPTATVEREYEAKPGEKVLKVSQEKIDVFMNLIGELLISKNNLNAFEKEVSEKYALPEIANRLKETADTIARISNQLQANIMDIRMLPLAQAFSKFPRMIRDLSKKLDKKIRLEISGEDTEIDKNIIEALADPLIHLIRNAADHGIETPDERINTGKPEEGTVKLEAYNQGQSVVIRISDDGKGMEPGKLKKRAMERALLPPEKLQQMDRNQLLGLIFLPGFSMAGQVSDVSGRGVGMDVVKTNIEKLGGDTQVESSRGKGTVFTIKLPLTMAIGRGLEVEAQNNIYYIPLESIIETLRVPMENVYRYKGKEITVIRDELIPVFRLAEQLGLENSNGNKTELNTRRKESLVILNHKGQKIGLQVDNYYNESEYVIKPLTGGIGNIDGISGAMITGEGKVHLILDLMRLF
jgi:two-component system, chemotaxis family, sensor kinase CheA